MSSLGEWVSSLNKEVHYYVAFLVDDLEHLKLYICNMNVATIHAVKSCVSRTIHVQHMVGNLQSPAA